VSQRIIEADRSIILGADLEPEAYETLMPKLTGLEGLSGVKIGFEVALGMSLESATDIARAAMGGDFVIIYDHQKAGNDIPDTSHNFGRAMRRARVDAAILFPFTGPKVEEAWIKSLQDNEIGVIVGSEMTHPEFKLSEGGRIADNQLLDIFAQAVELGVRDFVVPGNKPERVGFYRRCLEESANGPVTLYAPGFVSQGGEISKAAEAAGDNWHAIVARAIVNAEDPRAAAKQQVRAILGGE